MRRAEFMKELEYLLQDIPEEEKGEALAYYRDYLEDAGDENEEQVIQDFGSPERVAAIIRSDLAGNLEEGGEFTESGYTDARFKEPNYQVVEHKATPDGEQDTNGGNQRSKASEQDIIDRTWFKRLLKVGLLFLILAIAAPIILGVGGTVVSVAFGILFLVIMAIICIGLLTITGCVGAVALLVVGAGMVISQPAGGVFLLGCGIFVLGLSLIGIAVSVLVYGKFIPFCIRGTVDLVSRLFNRGRRKSA